MLFAIRLLVLIVFSHSMCYATDIGGDVVWGVEEVVIPIKLLREGAGLHCEIFIDNAKNQMTFCSNAAYRVWNTYDHLGRRIGKTVSGEASYDSRYLYDGWNMIAEIFSSGTARHYLWGLDLSGTEQGAGGVGGLLGFTLGTTWFIPLYDANGNITGYVSSSVGQVTKQFEYDAFGSAPSEARRFLRGGSPRRVRISHPLVPSVGTMEEESNPNEVV